MSDGASTSNGTDASDEFRRPSPGPGRVRVPHEEGDNPRHFINYTFYKLDPKWRRLAAAEREQHKAEFAAVLDRWREKIMVRTFTAVGVRADCDFLVWRATPRWEDFQEMTTELLQTAMGAWLEAGYVYTATTKGSQYMKHVKDAGFTKERPLDIVPVDRKYIIVYPMDKQRRWYGLPQDERGAAMREHAIVGREYPGIKINTSYSFGIDDQEFMVAFETDSVHDFLDLMMELRGTEASSYTERDTPIFTCTLMGAREVLDTLGGAPAASTMPREPKPIEVEPVTPVQA